MTALHRYSALAILLLLVQGAFWNYTADQLPKLGVVPELASHDELHLMAFGDEQLLYRIMAFRLNNTGDTFGRFTALRDYDLERLYHWFTRLNQFDNRSDIFPALASYYFSQTQDQPQVIHMVNYLYEYSHWRPEEKWWWLTQAVYLAQHKLEDLQLALDIAQHLEGVRGIPHWAQQMPAFVHEERGEMGAAFAIMKNILAEDEDLTKGELNYMHHFFKERVERLEEVEELLEKRRQELETSTESSGEDEVPAELEQQGAAGMTPPPPQD